MQILAETSRSLGEYLLLPNYTPSTCTAETVDLTAPVVRHEVGAEAPVRIALPVVNAIMQAVSSPRLAVALAQCGGLGFIQHGQAIGQQAADIAEVKRHKAGFRPSDVNVEPATTLDELARSLHRAKCEVAAVTDDGSPHGRFLGLISAEDYHLGWHRPDEPVSSRMRHVSDLVTADPSVTLPEANALIWDHRLAVLPVVNRSGILESLVLRRDYALHKRFRNSSLDEKKRLIVAAGINTHDYRERVGALLDAGADLLCVDSSDGFSEWQKRTIEYVKNEFGPDVLIGGGNVVDANGFRFLADAGADFVKVGIGGGSICITRAEKGIGRGQASALIDVVAERDAYAGEYGIYIPVCCDGGIMSESHMAIALAIGADFVMLGRYFARFDESPSALVRVGDRLLKEYWGEGSRRAQNWSRYEQGGTSLVFEEGVDGYVPYAGSIYDSVATSEAKLRSTLVSCGAMNLRDLTANARLVLLSEHTFTQSSHDILQNQHRVVA